MNTTTQQLKEQMCALAEAMPTYQEAAQAYFQIADSVEQSGRLEVLSLAASQIEKAPDPAVKKQLENDLHSKRAKVLLDQTVKAAPATRGELLDQAASEIASMSESQQQLNLYRDLYSKVLQIEKADA